jgi:VanZ family protein
MVLPCKHGWRGWLWPLVLAAFIVVASGRSSVAAPEIVGIDKVTHFFVFGLLATLVVRNGFPRSQAWIAVVAVSVFGLTDEWHQSFTPGRRVEVADWVADTLGALVAVACYVGWPAYQRCLERGLKRRVEKPAAMPPNRDVA